MDNVKQIIRGDDLNELDLFELLDTIIRRKKIIIACLAISLAFFVLYTILSPKYYAVRALLEIGTIRNDNAEFAIEEPDLVAEKIRKDVFCLRGEEKFNNGTLKSYKVEATIPEGTRLIELRIISSDPSGARAFLQDCTKRILDQHSQAVKQQSDIIAEDIREREAKLLSLNEESSDLKKFFLSTIEGLNNRRFSAYGPNVNILYKDPAEIKKEIENEKLEINSKKLFFARIRQTKVIKPATIDELVKPKLLINIIVGFTFGILLGLFLVFSREWFEKSGGRCK